MLPEDTILRGAAAAAWLATYRATWPVEGAEWQIDSDSRGRSATRLVQRRVAELADRQHGAVARQQLIALGIPAHVIDRWVCARRLTVIHHGVYSFGHRRLTLAGFRMAAVLAGGPTAALSHRTAAAHMQTLDNAFLWHVTITTGSHRSRSRLVVHRAQLHPDDTIIVDGVPCTSVARTAMDIAGTAGRATAEQMLDRAEFQRIFDRREFDALLDRSRGRRGVARLRSILAEYDKAADRLRSRAEERARALILASSLPRPEFNAWLQFSGGNGAEVDVLWRDERVILEIDGRRSHEGVLRSVRDEDRDDCAETDGYTVLRRTWWQVTREGDRLLADLAMALRVRRVADRQR